MLRHQLFGRRKAKERVVSPFLALWSLGKAGSIWETREKLGFEAGLFLLQNPKLEMELRLGCHRAQ